MSTQTTDQNWHRKTLNTPLLICLLVWFKRKRSEWSCWLQIISWKHWSTRQHIPPQCLQWFHREPLVFRSDPTVSFNVTFIHVTQEDLSSCETRGRWWVLKGCDMTKCCWMLNRSEISCCCKSAALQRDVRRRRGGEEDEGGGGWGRRRSTSIPKRNLGIDVLPVSEVTGFYDNEPYQSPLRLIISWYLSRLCSYSVWHTWWFFSS